MFCQVASVTGTFIAHLTMVWEFPKMRVAMPGVVLLPAERLSTNIACVTVTKLKRKKLKKAN
jgi:hypothetical protein